MWRIVFSYVNIFVRNMCLANYGASEAVYPCNVVEKIHEYFRSKISCTVVVSISCSLASLV
jgi:hypothetical protein